MTPSLMEHCDLDLATGGFEFEEQEIISHLYEKVTVSTISITENEPQRRNVSFDPNVIVHTVKSIYDYTDQEFEATWLCMDEMDRIRESVLNEAMLLDVGVQGKSSTTRGLESRTKKGYQAKRRNRTKGYAAVFFEIECQDHDQLFSEQKIADAYTFYSKPCTKIAQAIAKEDALEAMKIYDEESNSCHSKKSNNNKMNYESNFRKTKRRDLRKQRLVTLGPRNRLARSCSPSIYSNNFTIRR